MIFAGIELYLNKLVQVFQISIHVHPCHPLRQTTGNSFNAYIKSEITKLNNFFGIQLMRKQGLAF